MYCTAITPSLIVKAPTLHSPSAVGHRCGPQPHSRPRVTASSSIRGIGLEFRVLGQQPGQQQKRWQNSYALLVAAGLHVA